MTGVLRDLIDGAFLLGRHKPFNQSASAKFTSRQGLLIAAIGLYSLLCPQQVGETTGNKAAAAGDNVAVGAVQVLGVCTIAIGYINFAGGRANCEWFTAVAIFEKLAAVALFVGIYLTGNMSLETVLTQAILDGAIALYTLYLWQRDIAQRAEPRKQL